MPAWLYPQAKRYWSRLVPQLEAMGVLTTVDGEALARYCQTLARWRRAQAKLLKGETYETKTTAGHPVWRPRPEVAIAARLAIDLARLEALFGMTPSARTSLTVTAIFNLGRSTPPAPTSTDSPAKGATANVIEGKDRFFGGKPA